MQGLNVYLSSVGAHLPASRGRWYTASGRHEVAGTQLPAVMRSKHPYFEGIIFLNMHLVISGNETGIRALSCTRTRHVFER